MMKTILPLLLLLQFQCVLGQKTLEQIISEVQFTSDNNSTFHYYDSAKENQGVSIQNETQILKQLHLKPSDQSEYYLTGKYDINDLIVLFISKYRSSENHHFAILLDTSLNVIDRLDETAYYNDEGFYDVKSWISYNIFSRHIHNIYNNPEYVTKRYSISASGFIPIKNQVIINTPSGIRIRNKPTINSAIVASAPNLEVFDFLSTDSGEDSTAVVDNGKQLKNHWLKIATKDSLQQLGYVFGAFAKRHIEVVTNEYKVMLDEISKEEFNREEAKKYNNPIVEKIKDVKHIKRVLQHQLNGEFDKNEFFSINKIVTDNGKELIGDYFEDCDITAYYPAYHYLLLECGHSSDYLIDLKNGKDVTQLKGNPDYYVPSPQNTFRLNGYYNGQSNVHYLEKNTNNGTPEYFLDVSSFISAPYIKKYFWIDDNTFLIKVESEIYRIQLQKL